MPVPSFLSPSLTAGIEALTRHYADTVLPLWRAAGWNEALQLPYESLDDRSGRIAVGIGHLLGRDNDLAHRITQIVDVVATLKRDKGTPQLVQLERTRPDTP